MLLTVSSLGVQPVVGSAYDLLVSQASPVALSLQLVEGERLDGASLVVHRTDGSGLATPSVLVERGPAEVGAGVEWITAGWGDVRALEGFTLVLAEPVERPRVRVMVARGGGGWQLPTGSVAVTTEDDRVRVMLYDTLADRVRVELLDARDRPVAMVLDDEEPLELELGNEPRQLSLAVRGGEPLLRWSGPIPDEGIVVSDLAARLGAARGGRRQGPLVLELRAEVAGDLELQWAFATSKVEDLVAAG